MPARAWFANLARALGADVRRSPPSSGHRHTLLPMGREEDFANIARLGLALCDQLESGLRFEATDLGWSIGDGPATEGAGDPWTRM